MRTNRDRDVDLNGPCERRTDEQLARVASRQGGTIARYQLLRLGLTPTDIQYRIRTGRLRPVYRGVYAVGHDAIPVRGRLFAALLLTALTGALSHRTAAALHNLIPSMPPFIDVTVTASRPRNRRDLIFHAASELEVATLHGLPLTTPARSNLERRFLRAPGASGLPEPVKEHPLGRYIADFYRPGHGLIVATDGRHTHGSPIAFVDDRIRDAELAIRDLVVIRVTDEQADHDLPATLDRLGRWFAGPGRQRGRAA